MWLDSLIEKLSVFKLLGICNNWEKCRIVHCHQKMDPPLGLISILRFFFWGHLYMKNCLFNSKNWYLNEIQMGYSMKWQNNMLWKMASQENTNADNDKNKSDYVNELNMDRNQKLSIDGHWLFKRLCHFLLCINTFNSIWSHPVVGLCN